MLYISFKLNSICCSEGMQKLTEEKRNYTHMHAHTHTSPGSESEQHGVAKLDEGQKGAMPAQVRSLASAKARGKSLQMLAFVSSVSLNRFPSSINIRVIKKVKKITHAIFFIMYFA